MPGELVCSTRQTRSSMVRSVGLFHSWSGGSLNLPYVISSAMEYVIETDILSNYQNPHMGSPTCGVKAFMEGNAKYKPF